MPEPIIRFDQLALIARLNTVLFPFDPMVFGRMLREKGFIVNDQLPRAAPPGARFELQGAIARKGDLAVTLDTSNMQVGVVATDVDSLLGEMSDVEGIVRKEFDLDLHSEADYYEIGTNGSVRANRSPLLSLHNHFSQTPLIKSVSAILEQEVSPFGLRFALANTPPNQRKWTEIKFEPELLNPNKSYSFIAVMRDPSREAVITFSRKLKETLTAILNALESS